MIELDVLDSAQTTPGTLPRDPLDGARTGLTMR